MWPERAIWAAGRHGAAAPMAVINRAVSREWWPAVSLRRPRQPWKPPRNNPGGTRLVTGPPAFRRMDR
eukprot:4020597-Prymnesium_polylepis.1